MGRLSNSIGNSLRLLVKCETLQVLQAHRTTVILIIRNVLLKNQCVSNCKFCQHNMVEMTVKFTIKIGLIFLPTQMAKKKMHMYMDSEAKKFPLQWKREKMRSISQRYN